MYCEIPEVQYVYNIIIDVDVEGHESYTPEIPLKIRNQGQKNTCVAESISSLKTLQNARKTGEVKELNYKYVWENGVRAGKGMDQVKTLDKLKDTKDIKYKINNVSNTINEEEVKKGILENHGVLIWIRMDDKFRKIGNNGVYDKKGKIENSTHLMFVTGYKYINGKLYWVTRNSWGSQWGDNGVCYIPCDCNLIITFYIMK